MLIRCFEQCLQYYVTLLIVRFPQEKMFLTYILENSHVLGFLFMFENNLLVTFSDMTCTALLMDSFM